MNLLSDLMNRRVERLAWLRAQSEALETFTKGFRGALLAHAGCPDELVEVEMEKPSGFATRFRIRLLDASRARLASVTLCLVVRETGAPFDVHIGTHTPIPLSCDLRPILEAVVETARQYVERLPLCDLEGLEHATDAVRV